MVNRPTDNSTVDISGKVTINKKNKKCFNFSMRCCMANKPTDKSTVDISGKVTIKKKLYLFFQLFHEMLYGTQTH